MILGEAEDRKMREAVLAAANPLLGRGVFVFLKLPENWQLLKTDLPPECNALGREIVGDGFRWITSGRIHAILINKKRNQPYPLFLEVREFIDYKRASGTIRKKFEKIIKKCGQAEKKKVCANGHEAQYVTWSSQKKMFFKRKSVTLAHLEYATYCNFTKRLIFLRISSSHIENFMKDKKEMLSILSSITCHF